MPAQKDKGFGCPGSAMSGYAREKSILLKTAKNESLTIYICSVESIEENPIKLPDSPLFSCQLLVISQQRGESF